MIIKNNKKTNFNITLSFLLFFIFINYIYFYLNLTTTLNNETYSFNELFINYQAGFIRRGLLGEISWILKHQLSIEPKIFFFVIFNIQS